MLSIFFAHIGGKSHGDINHHRLMGMSKRYRELVAAAINAKELAYAPYSKFRVGAAILAKDGRILTGCNIESSSYGLTICAERTAIFKAYSEGIRDFTAIAVVSDDPEFTPPCGACRQVLIDLAGDIDFVMANAKNKLKVLRLKSLLPLAFTSKNLNRIR
jgi:cytidine deaminase